MRRVASRSFFFTVGWRAIITSKRGSQAKANQAVQVFGRWLSFATAPLRALRVEYEETDVHIDPSVIIEPCANGAELCEIIGELRKRGHEKEFITKILEKRDKQLFPRDLFVAYVPTKRGGLRAAGLLLLHGQFGGCGAEARLMREQRADETMVDHPEYQRRCLPEVEDAGWPCRLTCQNLLFARRPSSAAGSHRRKPRERSVTISA